MDSKSTHERSQSPTRHEILGNWLRPSSAIERRSPGEHSKLSDITLNGIKYVLGDFVRLLPQTNDQLILEGDILYVRQIKLFHDEQVGVIFSGILLRKSIHFPTESQSLIEVTMMVDLLASDRKSLIEIDISATSLAGKCQVHFNHEISSPVPTTQPDFVCQSLFKTYYDSKTVSKAKIVERVFRKINSILYSSCDHDISPVDFLNDSHSKEWNYISGFSGGGGEIEGAKAAGAAVRFAFEKDEKAYQSLKANYWNDVKLKIVKADQFDILNDDKFKYGLEKVDILHLSTPCQYFSPAHRVEGVLDETNSAALFCTAAHLKYWNPKVHTQEQTAGLLERHTDYFFRLICDIFAAGYNVRWKICQFRNFELSGQKRRRLIIIASR
jgi:hypothetical protein